MKVLGTANPADLMTKYLTREKVDNAIDKMSQVVQEGRAHSSLDIQGHANRVESVQESNFDVGGARASAAKLDYWRTDGEKIVRVHTRSRSALFAATAKDVDVDNLGPIRTTRIMGRDGVESVLHDYWRASRRPQRHQPCQWTGTTTFHDGE